MHHRDGEPHNVVLVDLVEGLRMMSRVEGVPTEEAVKVGQRVAFEVREEDDELVAVFVPEQ
ncbi:MAG: OB-fold domain-containing protein, partial [Actinomycetota bacterium]|nr:OB-fold domain-containing protein [Actinomycetota bacterium]